jgi:putative two-component system response regulator
MAHKCTILVVDDDPIARATLEGLLLSEDYDLAFARDGREALAKAAELVPDLILLDVMMPGMDGFEVCRRLRADSFLAEVPIIMVTALDDRYSRLRGFEAGADEFVSKPFDSVELRARVRTVTQLNRYHQLLEERASLERANAELALAYDATIEGWARTLELRDVETAGHARRVTEMTLRLARAMGMSEDELRHVRRGALLHDVGKLGIPDRILFKPGPLLDEEREIMRRHPVYVYELLSPIAYLRPALDIPYCHHEKWDGTGYPRGLKGEQIPLAARIFAVVDVWDALTSDRPYHKAWSKERTLAYIEEEAGKSFEPRVVERFLELMRDV